MIALYSRLWRCACCDLVSDERDLSSVTFALVEDPFLIEDEVSACPACGSEEVFPARRCEECQKIENEDDIIFGLCGECRARKDENHEEY